MEAIASCLCVVAGLAAAMGQSARAARLLGAAEAIIEQAGAIMFRRDLPILEWTRAAVHQALPESAVATSWDAGRALSLEDAAAEARAVLDEAAQRSSA